MNSRYKQIKIIDFQEYQLDIPVEVVKASIIFDSQTKNHILQLKLRSITSKIITSTHVVINCFDDAGDAIFPQEPIRHSYLVDGLKPRAFFGAKEPIFIDPKTREVKIEIEKVVFVDKTVWRNQNNPFVQVNQEKINVLDSYLLEQFRRELMKLPEPIKEPYRFIPMLTDDYWACACGRPNSNETYKCVRCGIEKETVFRILDPLYLQEQLKIFEDREAQKREEERALKEQREKERIEKEEAEIIRLQIIKAEKKQRIMKTIRRSVAVALTIALLIGAYYGIREFRLWSQYNRANELHETQNFDEALAVFAGIIDYRDVSILHTNVIEDKAKFLYQAGQYDEAVGTLVMIEEIRDVENLKDDIIFNKHLAATRSAYGFLESGDIDSAFEVIQSDQLEETEEILMVRKEYLNTDDKMTLEYMKAVVCFRNREYEEVESILSKMIDRRRLREFLDSEIIYSESVYKISVKAFEDSDLVKAYKGFAKLDEEVYPDIVAMKKTIIDEVNDIDWYERYEKAVESFNKREYGKLWKSISSQIGHRENDANPFDLNRMYEYKDITSYWLAAYVMDMSNQYKNGNIIEGWNWNIQRLNNLYVNARKISDFKNMNRYLTDPIFTAPRLLGRWSSGGNYFRMWIPNDAALQTEYNLPWYDGEYMNLIDNGKILQIGDTGNWRNVFRFDISDDNRTLNVYSYKDGRTYTLYKN